MSKLAVTGAFLFACLMWFLLGYSLSADHYRPMLEKAQGELAITKSELAQAKDELATFQAIVKQLVDDGWKEAK